MDMEAASMYIGFSVNSKEFEEHFVSAGKAIMVSYGKYFFPDFIEHQYPGGLQDDNKAHKNIIAELKKYDFLKEEIISKIVKNEPKNVLVFFVKNKGASKGLQSTPKGVQGIGIGIGQGIGNGNGIGNTGDKKWNTKPGKEFHDLELDKTKGGAVVQLFKISKNHDLNQSELNLLWNIFKIQNLNGEKYYGSVNDVYSHFINWSKTQNIDNGNTGTTKKANGASYKTAGQDAYAERLKRQLSELNH